MANLSLSLEGLSVFIATPCNRDIPWQTHVSMVKTVCALKDRGVPFIPWLVSGVSIVEMARSLIAAQFLKTELSRLFWVDSDMAWEPDAFVRILALSSKMPVVGASYPVKRDPDLEFLLNLEGCGGSLEANEWGCVPVQGLGLGFACVAREVVERLAASVPVVRHQGADVPMIFRTATAGGEFVGEDMCFFADCKAAGWQPWVDPKVVLGHVGGKEWRGKLIDALQPQRTKLEP